MQLIRLIGLAAAAAMTAGVAAPAAETKKVSLEDCIQMALEHNLDVQIQRYNPLLNKFALAASYSIYEPTLTFGASHTAATDAPRLDSEKRFVPGSTTEQDRFSLAMVNGYLPTGLGYSISSGTSSTSDSTGGGFANANLGISFTQPLLRDFWIDQPRVTIQLNKRRVKTSELDFEYQVMNTVYSVQNAYYSLVAAQENVAVQELALDLAKKQLAENRKRVEVGVMAPLDEKQAESDVAANETGLLSARNALTQAQNRLKNLITDRYASEAALTLAASDKLTAVVQPFNRQESWAKCILMRPDLKSARTALENYDLNVKLAKNQLFPSLDLTTGYTRSGGGLEYNRAIGMVADGDSPSWNIGAQFSIPLSQRQARYNYRSLKEQREQSTLQVKKLEQGLLVGIDDAITQAQNSLQQVESSRKAREYAEEAWRAEQKKLDNGKSTSFQVLYLLNVLTQRRFAEIQAVTAYNEALAGLAYAEGSTLERNAVRVQIYK
jgi:outer membrane protein TolC